MGKSGVLNVRVYHLASFSSTHLLLCIAKAAKHCQPCLAKGMLVRGEVLYHYNVRLAGNVCPEYGKAGSGAVHPDKQVATV